ncbi:MAG: hypothetical protein J7623_08000 [Chitinophaga sp.]|uniref:hypothetical protein n=1 Tax=Chitinophaga sp. TaxID=1869181 RepID=UPI001B052C48|nr:hypothetical protein [Chitinophaga sp.]MBO9728563.1 hypothetical protein [Chitinophaga sp.]
MMSNKKYQQLAILLLCLLFGCMACNKEEIAPEKAIHVIINGYNGGGDPLEVQIDTTKYDKTVMSAKYVFQPASLVGFNAVYTYRSGSVAPVLTIRNPANDSILYRHALPVAETKALVNFLYVDGKIQELQPPQVNPGTNQLGFYLQYTDSEALVDIFLYRVDENTGTTYRAYLAKNVRPRTWTYVDYLPAKDFENANDLNNATIYFTKAGTTDEWAFGGDETPSKLTAQGLSLPKAGEKGLVQPYFIIPQGWELGFSRLFFYADRR